jgi:hypothetical protein
VASLQQSEYENYRAIVCSPDRTEILLIAEEDGFRLPSVEIPHWERTAENLCAAVKNKWNCEAVCLFTLQEVLSGDPCDGRHYQIMETYNCQRGSRGEAVCAPICSLARQSFHDAEEYEALDQFLAVSNSCGENPTLPFARPGWFGELRRWISEIICPLGFELTGPVRQFNASCSFSLLRFETTGPAVWFKAVGAPNRHEFGITLKLAELLPNYLPKIIGTRPDWNGWLSFEVEGTTLADTQEINAWEEAAATLARLQIDAIPNLNKIAAAGAHDLSGTTLSAFVDPFFEVIAQLMKQQTKVAPPMLSEPDLQLLKERINESLAELQALSLPDTLGHLDLNPGNIIASPRGCKFLDWAEAYVGNPVFSLQYLLEHFRRSVIADQMSVRRLKSAYAEEWRNRVSSTEVNEALQLSPLLAAFAYAASSNGWRDQEILDDSRRAGYLRSLTRRMNREANQLNERRSPCLC